MFCISVCLLTFPSLFHYLYCPVIKARAYRWNDLGKAEEFHDRERSTWIQPYSKTALDHIYIVASFVIIKKTKKIHVISYKFSKKLKNWKSDECSSFPSARLTSCEPIRASWFIFLLFACLRQSILTEYQGKHCLNYNGILTLFSKLELEVYLESLNHRII